MPAIANPTLLAIGLALFVVGWMLRNWAARHSLTDQLTDAAWEAVRRRDATAIGREIGQRVGEIGAAPTTFGKAQKVAGMGIRHALAQVAGWGGLLALIAGLGLAALGVFWR